MPIFGNETLVKKFEFPLAKNDYYPNAEFNVTMEIFSTCHATTKPLVFTQPLVYKSSMVSEAALNKEIL